MTFHNFLFYAWFTLGIFLTIICGCLFVWYVTWPYDDKIIELLVPVIGGATAVLAVCAYIQADKNHKKGGK